MGIVVRRPGVSLSVVIPTWNEEAVIEGLVDDVDRTIATRLDSSEIIVVDDASTDATGTILDSLAAKNKRLTVIHEVQNRGHGPAVLHGLERATGAWVFLLDSDRQFEVADFWKLWGQRQRADLVLGVRRHRQDPLYRVLLSRVIAIVVSLLVRQRLRDPNVPFRLLCRDVIDDLLPCVPAEALAPSIMIAMGSKIRGARIVETPVTHRPRPHGRSSLTGWRLVRFSLSGLRELLGSRRDVLRAQQQLAGRESQEAPFRSSIRREDT